MTVERQIEIIEAQIASFDNLLHKLQYIHDFFGNDSSFSKEAIHIVISNLAKDTAYNEKK